MAAMVVNFYSQNIEEALYLIEQNNHTIKMASALVAAEKAKLKTGLNPDDPFFEADYMIGRPVSGGNQFDFIAVQPFDFPTVYVRRKAVSESKGKFLSNHLESTRVQVLMQAKELLFERIYLNKKLSVYNDRLVRAEKVTAYFEELHKSREINVLDLNKSRIYLLRLRSKIETVHTHLSINKDHLKELNGGQTLEFELMGFPQIIDLPDIDVLTDSLEAGDPQLQSLLSAQNVKMSELDLTRAEKLPSFETGYHYQSVLGQTFNGGHIGLTIPLWKNKHTVEAKELDLEFTKVQVKAHKVEHHHHIFQAYQNYLSIKKTFSEYADILEKNTNEEVLDKLLEAKEIDFIKYSSELAFFYEAEDEMLHLEKSLHLAISQLLKYKL